MDEATRNLLKKARWLNPVDLYIGEIIEYDMKDGGLSIIKEENLLPPNEIRRLEQIPKGIERSIAVGNLKYSKNPAIRDTGKKLEELFAKYRIMLGEANDLEESDIFSIKRDAVFTKRYLSQTEFGKYINFRDKHHYDVYFLLGKDELKTSYESRHRTYEVYYDTFTDDISFKGIRDELVESYHMDGIVKIVKKYLKYVSRFDYEGATKYIVTTIDLYKRNELPIECYREFNDESDYKFQIGGKAFGTMEADMSMIEYIDRRYNFNHILVPMLNMASLGINNTRQKTR